MIRRRLTAVVALVATACTGWRVDTAPSPGSAASTMGRGEAGVIRLRLKDGREIYLRAPSVVADSIAGYSRDERSDYARQAFAIKDVESIGTYGFDAGKTVLLVGASVAATAALVAACVASFSNI